MPLRDRPDTPRCVCGRFRVDQFTQELSKVLTVLDLGAFDLVIFSWTKKKKEGPKQKISTTLDPELFETKSPV